MKDREDLDQENQPFNPILYQSIREILETQIAKLPEYPEDTEFECRRCGDCCQYFYMHFEMPEKLLDELGKRAKYPHGYWVLMEKKRVKRGEGPMQFFMPTFSAHHGPMFHWTGNIPEDRQSFLELTGRRHGYWVFTGEDIVVYSPSPCIHLAKDDDGLYACDIYSGRPEICREYTCRRHPC